MRERVARWSIRTSWFLIAGGERRRLGGDRRDRAGSSPELQPIRNSRARLRLSQTRWRSAPGQSFSTSRQKRVP